MNIQKISALRVWTIAASAVPAVVAAGEGLDVKAFRDKVIAAYEKAHREDKYLLLFFSSGDSRDCVEMRDNLEDEQLAGFAQRWVVADTDPKYDAEGKKFAEALGVDTFPSLILIKPTAIWDGGEMTDSDVVGRLKFAQSADETQCFFERAMHVYENRGKVLDLTTYHDRVFAGWEAAKREGKYFVLFFNSDYNGFADRTMEGLTDPRMAKYQENVIFVDSDINLDTDVELFIKRFDVKRYPTILVLRPIQDPATGKVKMVDLVGRMSGEQSAQEVDEYFQMSIEKYESERGSQASPE